MDEHGHMNLIEGEAFDTALAVLALAATEPGRVTEEAEVAAGATLAILCAMTGDVYPEWEGLTPAEIAASVGQEVKEQVLAARLN